MPKPLPATLLILLFATGSVPRDASQEETLHLPGLSQPVEIITDRWGIAHIYAETEDDLFFAQGFNAARDRPCGQTSTNTDGRRGIPLRPSRPHLCI